MTIRVLAWTGTVRGFRLYALREIRKAAMAGITPAQADRVNRWLRRARIADLRAQILGGGDAA